MCGRFALSATPEEVRALFAYADTPNFPPRYNIAPTQPIATVREAFGARRFVLVRWGLVPGWVKDPASFSLLINARAETAAEKPSFRAAMRHRRGRMRWVAAGVPFRRLVPPCTHLARLRRGSRELGIVGACEIV